MTNKELQERLKEYPDDVEIRVWCPDLDKIERVTGFLHDPSDNVLEITSDVSDLEEEE